MAKITNFKIYGDDRVITRVRVSMDNGNSWGILYEGNTKSRYEALVNVIEDTWEKLEMDIYIIDAISGEYTETQLDTSMIQQSPSYDYLPDGIYVEFSVLENNAGFKAIWTNRTANMCDCVVWINIPETESYSAFEWVSDYYEIFRDYRELNYVWKNNVMIFTCSDPSVDLSNAVLRTNWDGWCNSYSDRVEVHLSNNEGYTTDKRVTVAIPGTDTHSHIVWSDYVWLDYEEEPQPNAICANCGDPFYTASGTRLCSHCGTEGDYEVTCYKHDTEYVYNSLDYDSCPLCAQM